MKRLLLILFLAGWALLAPAETLAELDRILTKASNVEEFLSKPELIDEYYEAASKYYGGKFPKENYLAILDQLRNVITKVPEIKERAWEVPAGQSFSIRSDIDDSGLILDRERWKPQLQKRLSALEEQAGKQTLAEVEQVWKTIAQELAEKVAELEGSKLGKKALGLARAKLYQDMTNDPRVKQALATVALAYFRTPEAKQILDAGSADRVLNWFATANGEPAKVFESAGVAAPPSFLLPEMRAQFPSAKSLIAESGESFTPKMVRTREGTLAPAPAGPGGEFRFVALPRRFHGFFKGIAINECVGGGPGFSNWKQDLSPERWATSALRDSQMHYVEVNGKFDGFVHQVPLQGAEKAPHAMVASIDLGASALRQRIYQKNADGSLKETTLYSAWLQKALEQKPAEWGGFVVGNTAAISNAGALATLRLDGSYVLAGERIPHTLYMHHDPMALKIPSLYTPVKDSNLSLYAGQMIFEAAAKGVTELVLLKPTEQSAESWIRERLAAGDRKSIETWLYQFYLGAWDPVTQNRAGTMVVQLRDAGLLDLLVDNGFTQFPTGNQATLGDYGVKLREAGLSWEEIRKARLLASGTVTTEEKLMNALLPKVKTGSDFAQLVVFTSSNPNDDYKKKMGKFIDQHVDTFLKLSPTYEDVRSLRLAHTAAMSWNTYEKLTTYQASYAPDAAALASMFQFDTSDYRPDTADRIARSLQAGMERMEALNPSLADLHSLSDFAEKLQPRTSIAKKGWNVRTRLAEVHKERLTRELRAAPDAAAYAKLIEAEAALPGRTLLDSTAEALLATLADRSGSPEEKGVVFEAAAKLLARSELSESKWESLLERALPMAESPSQFVRLLDIAATLTRRNAAKKHFLARASQLEALFLSDTDFRLVFTAAKLGLIAPPVFLKMFEAQLERVTGVERLAQLAKFSKILDAGPLMQQAEEAYLRRLDRSLSQWNTASDLLTFHRELSQGRREFHLQVMERMAQHASSAERLLAAVSPQQRADDAIFQIEAAKILAKYRGGFPELKSNPDLRSRANRLLAADSLFSRMARALIKPRSLRSPIESVPPLDCRAELWRKLRWAPVRPSVVLAIGGTGLGAIILKGQIDSYAKEEHVNSYPAALRELYLESKAEMKLTAQEADDLIARAKAQTDPPLYFKKFRRAFKDAQDPKEMGLPREMALQLAAEIAVRPDAFEYIDKLTTAYKHYTNTKDPRQQLRLIAAKEKADSPSFRAAGGGR